VKVAIYTSVTAGRDSIKEDQNREGADLILFTDQLPGETAWEVRRASELFQDPRRNSRIPKLLAHQYLPGYDYSLWVDGSIRLLASVHDLIEGYLRGADIAFFRHPLRDCIYEEAAVCSEQRLDDPSLIAAQVAKYAREGYPPHNGLNEGGVILRRHTAEIEAFNNAWWSELCRFSRRDQLSLNYVLHKLRLRPALLPGTIADNPGIVAYEGHLAASAEEGTANPRTPTRK
jgi:alkaline ceramidase TOD1/glycosyltransferase MUCI70-like protein